MNGDGVHTIGQSAGVRFDFDGDGRTTPTGWVAKDDGLLVLDRNGDGQVNSGQELFGDAVTLANGAKAADGFAALADLDSNHDGRIDASDAQFSQLKVWVDANSDGVSQAGELRTLGEVGVQALSLLAESSDATESGNQIGLVSTFTTLDGQTHQLADVWFGSQQDSATSAVAASDAEPALDMGFSPGMFAWQQADGDAGQAPLDVAGALPDAELPAADEVPLDLRDLLGPQGGDDAMAGLQLLAPVAGPAAADGALQVAGNLADQGPAGLGTLPSDLQAGLAAGPHGAEEQVLQDLLNRHKLDMGN